MKLVQINCSANGSTGKIARAIHNKALQDGINSYFFYGFGSCNEKYTHRIGNNFDLHMHAFLSRWTGLQGYFSTFHTIKLISAINRIDPDVVHLHNLHGSYLNFNLLFKDLKKQNYRVIVTLHDCWLFTGKCAHFTNANCYKWIVECSKCPQLSCYPRSKIFDFSRKIFNDKKKWLSDGRWEFITVSNWLKSMAEKSFLSNSPIRCIYNGIDINTFKPLSTITPKYPGKFVILGVASNWNNAKGLDKFIELSKQLQSDEIIVLVGLREDQQVNMPENLRGIRNTNNQIELAELYNEAGVLVNYSLEETFGLVTCEALSCGTPVIVFNSTACAEVVDEKCGFVLEKNEVDNVYNYISKIRHDRGFDAELLHDYIAQKYSSERMIEDYIDVYKC